MLVEQYFQTEAGKLRFTRQQGSDFAKGIANDFNPLHDVDSKRFCIPGDLLFATVLASYGVSQHMQFQFTGMVTEDVVLQLPSAAPELTITGENDKEYLSVQLTGDSSDNSDLIDNLTKSYVAFSGQTFPHILIPLMKQENVMINPARPMVMYQSMLIDLQRLDLTDIELELDEERTRLEVNGKRGSVCLAFTLKSGDTVIGRGEKHMVLSGLRPFEQAVIDTVADDYAQWKAAYSAD